MNLSIDSHFLFVIPLLSRGWIVPVGGATPDRLSDWLRRESRESRKKTPPPPNERGRRSEGFPKTGIDLRFLFVVKSKNRFRLAIMRVSISQGKRKCKRDTF